MNGASIEVQFLAHDEGGRELLEKIAAFPKYSVERFEMEGFLFMTLMRISQREADRARALERREAARKRRAAAKSEGDPPP